MASILKIPRLSIFDEECCMFSAKFKSFRSSYSLKKELDDIMKSYEKTICDSKTYYYDKKHNITISDYGVESGIFINYFYIVYDKGNYKCDSTINKNLENVLANIKNNIPTNTND